MTTHRPHDPHLDAYWMPFTANRQFKQAPRLLARAEGMHYWTDDGRQILDGVAGLWCVNAGHARPRIVQAIQAQAAELDYAPPFQMGHPKAFALAERLAALAPADLNRVFFTNSGSESVETALKIALAYHRARGEGSRTRLIGRERGYHGVNFGGMSVGGIVGNRKAFGTLLGGVDHLRHTHDPARNAFSVGQPAHGAELADDLERLVALHDASTIAAVIVEPVAGSTGVLIPPQGYLQRLRDVCDRHGILLIFDEVITGFGRTGNPFGAQTFGVTPDLITTAKGITSSYAPLGAVLVRKAIADEFINEDAPDYLTEPVRAARTYGFLHGLTFGGHPVSCAAANANLDIMLEEDLPGRARETGAYLRCELEAALGNHPNVGDIRGAGLFLGVELVADRATKETFRDSELLGWLTSELRERGIILRNDDRNDPTSQLCPPLVITREECDRTVAVLAELITELGRRLGSTGTQHAAS